MKEPLKYFLERTTPLGALARIHKQRKLDKKFQQSKGYELVCATKTNAIFVDAKYFGLFGIEDNSVNAIMTDESLVTHIFCGYDGTVFIRGCGMMPWQQIPYKESRLQQLPRWARKVVGDRNILRRKLGKHFRRLRRKNII